VVRTADENAYDSTGCVRGPMGGRRLVEEKLQTVTMDENTLIASMGSETARIWLQVDGDRPGSVKNVRVGPVPPRPADQVIVKDAASIAAHADSRPLLRLDITAAVPADAHVLLPLAVPLGAESLTLRVTVSGKVREGGSVNFLAEGVKPSHPLKPLVIAQTLFSSIGAEATFEVVLSLSFGAQGRKGMGDALKTLQESRPAGITVEAEFGKPAEAAS